MSKQQQCGYVAIVGRPNVGKSTLLNHLIQQKISITSRKPQTTRHNVMGIKTSDEVQLIYVDTPGQHANQAKAINRYMNRVACSATSEVDVVIWVLDRTQWTEEDELVAGRLQTIKCPIVVVVNKIDRINEKAALIPHIEHVSKTVNAHAIIPISALKRENLGMLEKELIKHMPPGKHLYEADEITDKSSRFLAAELIREKIVRQLGAELPYQTAVEIEAFEEEGKVIHISALILVEREGQKRIIVGEKGKKLKKIGTLARMDMESLFDSKVMLKMWVKVKDGWSDDDRALRSLGFDE